MDDYIKIVIEDISQEQKELLIAQLSLVGYDGFEEGANYLHAFIPSNNFNAEELVQISPQFSYSKELIKARNWNETWEKSFQPVEIGKFCRIRANFHPPLTDFQFEIIITPKMSFGTGHHATTHLMIEFMQDVDIKEKEVLDFGTGTGILAILADKMGASKVLAIDNDDWSIRNAEENFFVNRSCAIQLKRTDSIDSEPQFDLILANINKHILLSNMTQLGQHLKSPGVLLMSGLLTGDRPEIEKEALKIGLSFQQIMEKNGWIALKFGKP